MSGSQCAGCWAATSEQVAQQVYLTAWPGTLPDLFHHQGTGILRGRQSQRGVIVDLQPGTGVRGARPPIPGVEPVIICEQDDEIHPAGTGIISHLRQQPASQAARPPGPPDTQVNNAERTQDSYGSCSSL